MIFCLFLIYTLRTIPLLKNPVHWIHQSSPLLLEMASYCFVQLTEGEYPLLELTDTGFETFFH